MKNPNPVNLTTADEIRARGWAAEARDKDGHLISTVVWHGALTEKENSRGLVGFIADYSTDCEVTIFPENVGG